MGAQTPMAKIVRRGSTLFTVDWRGEEQVVATAPTPDHAQWLLTGLRSFHESTPVEEFDDEPAPADEIHRIDIREFRELGFLQEANRLFFHPLGLALEVVVEDGGTERLGGVWDYRDDPEGMAFGPATMDPEKAVRVKAEFDRHVEERTRLFGDPIQRIES